jgi:hypothetical protein
MLALGVGAWRNAARGPTEREPNHVEEEATRLPPDTEVEAYLGQRLSEVSGDVDLFEIRNTASERVAAEIEVTSIPNMDVILELLAPGSDAPRLVSDARGLGQGERIPNVALEPGRTLVRVREKPAEGQLPTENVSDEYTIRWVPLDPDPSFEREPNDSLELAESLSVGSERRAWIGWPGDADTFCLDETADEVIAQVSALAEVDLVLRVVDQRTERSTKIDDKGVGRGETSAPSRAVEARQLCIEISTDPNDDRSRAAQPDETYGVRFITTGPR